MLLHFLVFETHLACRRRIILSCLQDALQAHRAHCGLPTEPTKKKKVFCVLVGVLFPPTDKGLCGLPTTWASGERRFYKSPKFFEENTKVLKRSPHLSLGDAIVFNIWHHKKRKRKGLASPVAMQFATLTDDDSDKRALTRMKDHRVFFSTSALHHSPRLVCMSVCLSVFLSFCLSMQCAILQSLCGKLSIWDILIYL